MHCINKRLLENIKISKTFYFLDLLYQTQVSLDGKQDSRITPSHDVGHAICRGLQNAYFIKFMHKNFVDYDT